MHSGQCIIHVEPVHVLLGHIPDISQLYILFKKVEYAKYILVSFLHMLQLIQLIQQIHEQILLWLCKKIMQYMLSLNEGQLLS